LSEYNFWIATAIPVPTLEGLSVFSSILPLKTFPDSPLPKKRSVLKFLVAVFNSEKLNIFKLGVSKIFASPPAPSELLDATKKWKNNMIELMHVTCRSQKRRNGKTPRLKEYVKIDL
jgi:CO dehydrogenase/acetyl-CoA synthase alpha subunit